MRRLLILPDPAALAAAAADEFVRAVAASTGSFRVALSGGSTPRETYRRLAAARVSWERVHFYWSDERCVPPDHADSNYRMARESLLDSAAIPAANVHRIPAESADPDDAARRYEEILRRELGAPPRFDWLFLGLGADGHTASLFPGSAAIGETERLVVSDKSKRRVTLTLPALNAAEHIIFLVSGAEKADMAKRVMEGPASEALPATMVRPSAGEILWILDVAAASKLSAH